MSNPLSEPTLMGITASQLADYKRFAEEKDVVRLLDELHDLRGKVAFYESRVKEMNQFKEAHK